VNQGDCNLEHNTRGERVTQRKNSGAVSKDGWEYTAKY
jgi:hypothetical protein